MCLFGSLTLPKEIEENEIATSTIQTENLCAYELAISPAANTHEVFLGANKQKKLGLMLMMCQKLAYGWCCCPNHEVVVVAVGVVIGMSDWGGWVGLGVAAIGTASSCVCVCVCARFFASSHFFLLLLVALFFASLGLGPSWALFFVSLAVTSCFFLLLLLAICEAEKEE